MSKVGGVGVGVFVGVGVLVGVFVDVGIFTCVRLTTAEATVADRPTGFLGVG